MSARGVRPEGPTTVNELAITFADLAQRYPDHVISRNAVGNLVFWEPSGSPIGWVDPLEPGWRLFD